MDRTERFYKIELLIRRQGGVSFAALRDALEVSPATLKRDLQYLRDRMDAPIRYDRADAVYRLEAGASTGAATHQLPGVWFSEAEIHALLGMHQMIAALDADGVLGRHLQPVLDKLNGMLGANEHESRQMMKRVRILSVAARPVPSRYFELVGSALQKRRRLQLTYLTRSRAGERSQRVVSPQRLVHYRGTWYLDAWCHMADGLRRFALDAFEQAQMLDSAAKEVALKTVERSFDGGYGIFGGEAAGGATLRFDAVPARWVAHETWHPRQQGRWLDDGRYELRLPYADATELVMDALRHAGQVEVVGDAALRTAFAARVAEAQRRLG